LSVEAVLVKGAGGVYMVDVDGAIVAKKSLDHGFPTEQQVVAAVQSHLKGLGR
jgi:predicted Rdx family selenoprotein